MSINNDNFSKSKSTKTFKKCSENHNVGKIKMIFKFGIDLVSGPKLL